MNRVVIPSQPTGLLPDAWRECVGTGRLNLALRADYQESAALVQREIGFRYIRGHGLLSDDMGVLRQSEGVTRYAFTYVDQVVDSYLRVGLKPFLELGFMPSALASGDQTVFWWKGNVTPPRSHDDWAALVRAVLRMVGTTDARVVAEGVETAVQVAHLRALGCTLGQGHFLGAPAPWSTISRAS